MVVKTSKDLDRINSLQHLQVSTFTLTVIPITDAMEIFSMKVIGDSTKYVFMFSSRPWFLGNCPFCVKPIANRALQYCIKWRI